MFTVRNESEYIAIESAGATAPPITNLDTMIK